MLIFLKIYLDKRKKTLETVEAKYHASQKELIKNLDKKPILLGYCRAIGWQIFHAQNVYKQRKLQRHAAQLQLYDRLYVQYHKTYIYESKLYLLFLMALLGDPKGKEFYLEILEKSQKYELLIWGLLALSLSVKKDSDIHILYYALETVNKKTPMSQKLIQFFLGKAYLSVDQKNLIHFLKAFQPKKFTLVARGAIYALKETTGTHQLQKQLLHILRNNKNEIHLVVAVLRVLHHWGYKEESLIKKYINSKHEIIRIVCAKIGMDMIKNPNSYTIFLPYLSDPNPYVRKNTLDAFKQHGIHINSISKFTKKNNHIKLNNSYISCFFFSHLSNSIEKSMCHV